MVQTNRGTFTTEDVVATLRAKNNPILHGHARIALAAEAAGRVHRLAFSAQQAAAAGGVEEATCLLRALDFATDAMSNHVEAALIALAQQGAA